MCPVFFFLSRSSTLHSPTGYPAGLAYVLTSGPVVTEPVII